MSYLLDPVLVKIYARLCFVVIVVDDAAAATAAALLYFFFFFFFAATRGVTVSMSAFLACHQC